MLGGFVMKLNIKVKLNRIKNIDSFEYNFSFDRGIYALVGENAVGKSTVMAAIASTVYPNVIARYRKTEITSESSIELSCCGTTDTWIADSIGSQMNRKSRPQVVFNGIYEGSIFSGTREPLNK